MAAAALHIEKPEQPELAKHDSTILGRIERHELEGQIFPWLHIFKIWPSQWIALVQWARILKVLRKIFVPSSRKLSLAKRVIFI